MINGVTKYNNNNKLNLLYAGIGGLLSPHGGGVGGGD